MSFMLEKTLVCLVVCWFVPACVGAIVEESVVRQQRVESWGIA